MSNGLGFGFGLISSSNIAGDGVADYRSTVLADSPVRYYALNESNSDANADDYTGNQDLAYQNSPSRGDTPIANYTGNTAVTFSGGNQYLQGVQGSGPDLSSTDYSMEFVVNLSSTQADWFGLISYGSGSGNNWAIGRNSNTGDLRLYHASGYVTFSGAFSSIFDGTDHHVVFTYTYSNKACKFYLDGSLQDTQTHSAHPGNGVNGYFRIGASRDPISTDGVFDEVAVYTSELSSTRIAAHAVDAGYAAATIIPNVITSANSSDTTTTIDCSSVTEGYLMIILVSLWASREISSYPASWNLERLGNEGTSSGESRLYAFSKIAAATETSYDFTVNNILYGSRFSYSLLEIPKTGLGVRNATYSTDGTLGSLYSYSTDTLHLAFCGKADSSATEDVIHPSGYTEIVDGTGSLHNHAIAYKTISGASRSLHSGYEFTDPDNTGGTGDNNLSTIHLSISDAGPIVSENFEGTGTPVGFTNVIAGSGTISFDETTEVLEGSESLKVYSDSDTYTYVDLNHEYDHIVAIFGYKTDAMSNRKDVFFLDDEASRTATQALEFGSVSNYTKGITHSYGSILLTLTGTVNDFHYVRVEINRSGGVVKIARSNDKTFPTSGTNYAEDTSAAFNAGFSGTRYIAFGASNTARNSWYDDLEVTGEI